MEIKDDPSFYVKRINNLMPKFKDSLERKAWGELVELSDEIRYLCAKTAISSLRKQVDRQSSYASHP